MRNFLILCFLLSSAFSFGQQLQQVEQDLLLHLKKISYWRFGNDANKPGAYDSIVHANEVFEEKLLYYLNKYPTSINYPFRELQKENLTIATSADQHFRMYSWNSWTGGTMHLFNNICQIKTNDSTFARLFNDDLEEGDGGCWYSEIFSMNTGGKNLYLGYWHSQYSSSGSVQGIQLFRIENGGLNDSLKLIKTKSGFTNELFFEFNFFTVAERKERPVKLIYWNEKERTIKIPVVTEDLTVTKKFITYKYTGRYFEKLQQ